MFLLDGDKSGGLELAHGQVLGHRYVVKIEAPRNQVYLVRRCVKKSNGPVIKVDTEEVEGIEQLPFHHHKHQEIIIADTGPGRGAEAGHISFWDAAKSKPSTSVSPPLGATQGKYGHGGANKRETWGSREGKPGSDELGGEFF